MEQKIQITFADGKVHNYASSNPLPRIGEYVKSNVGEGVVTNIQYFFDEHGICGNNRIMIICTKDY